MATALFAVGGNRAQAEPRLPSQETVASWLHSQEGLVRSIRCVYECVCKVPNTPEYLAMIDRLEAEARKNGFGVRNARTQKDADERSYVKRWWRKGAMQRDEQYPPGADLASASPADSAAFDGQIVRRVSTDPRTGRLVGNVSTEQKEAWNASPRADPYTFLYAFYETPYSELVAKGKNFQAESVPGHPGFVQVRFDTASERLSDWSFTLVFDERRRLVGRETYLTEAKTGKGLRERMTYSDYQARADASGETIWFPRRLVNTLFASGMPGISYHYAVKEIEFNGELPDSLFQLEIPKAATVYDGVTGLGWLPPGEQPTTVFFPTHSRAWSRGRIAAAVGAVLLLLAIAAWAWRRLARSPR